MEKKVTPIHIEVHTPGVNPEPGFVFIYPKSATEIGIKDENGDEIIITVGSPARLNYVLVKSKSDFPSPVGGVISAADNTIYEINGKINVGNDRFNLGNNSIITGRNIYEDIIEYTGNLDLFTSVDKNSQVRLLQVDSPSGRVFYTENTTGKEKTNEFTLEEVFIKSCSKIGYLKNLKRVRIDNCFFDVVSNEGILSEGTLNGEFLMFDSTVKDVTGTFFKLNNSKFDLWESNRNELNIKLGSIGLSGLPNNGNINNKGLVTSNNWFGAGKYIDDNPASDVRIGGSKWDFLGNNNVPDITDNIATGYMSFEGNVLVTSIVTQNIWEKIAGLTIAGNNNLRFIMDGSNKMKYVGDSEYKGNIEVLGNAEVVVGSSNYGFTVFKNGVKLPNVSGEANVVNGKPNGFGVLAPVIANTDDYFEVYVRCLDSNKDVTITNMQVGIG